MELSEFAKYLLSLPTVYEIADGTQEPLKSERIVIVKSKLPLSDGIVQDIREYSEKTISWIYTMVIKNIYDNGERIIKL